MINFKKEIKGLNVDGRYYEDNIIEIVFKVPKLIFQNISLISDEIKKLLLKWLIKQRIPFTLVYNFENVEFVDSCTIGLAIQSKVQMDKYYEKSTNIYYLNVKDRIYQLYDKIGLNIPGFFVNCSSILDVIRHMRGDEIFCLPFCEFLNITEQEQVERLNFQHHRCSKYNDILYHGDNYPNIEKCRDCLVNGKAYMSERRQKIKSA